MERPLRKSRIGLIAVSIAAVASIPIAIAGDPTPRPPSDLAKRIQEITDAVLEHHIDPPARQQMILSGIKALYQASGVPVPAGLGRRVSAIATPEQLAGLLAEVWPKTKTTSRPVARKTLDEALLEGLLAAVPGGAELISAKDRKVAEQFEGNRYVGIHIALGLDDKANQPTMINIFERGPADRAGAKLGDLIEEIDGVATKGMALRDVIDRLRGEEGTDVTIKVRQPAETKSRTLRITRGQLPHATIMGFRKRPSGDWDVRLDGPDPIGYLKITEIAASTPHELRKMAQHLETQGARALILDLRGPAGTHAVHPAVLLADCLLDRGPIGRARTAHGETTYQSDPDALFRGWPMAVLVDVNTSGTAEWLAAALQDNHRATIVGTPTSGARRVRPGFAAEMMAEGLTGIRSKVVVGDGSWSVELLTGYLERGDGRPLSGPPEDAINVSRSLVVSRERPGKPVEIKTGVKPDLMAGPNAESPRRILQRRTPGPAPKLETTGPAPKPETTTSDPLETAIQLLKKSLKTL